MPLSGLTDRTNRTVLLKPLTLDSVIVVDPSSSQSVLPPSHRADSPVTVNDGGLAEMVKSFCPVTGVTLRAPEVPELPLWLESPETVPVTVALPGATPGK